MNKETPKQGNMETWKQRRNKTNKLNLDLDWALPKTHVFWNCRIIGEWVRPVLCLEFFCVLLVKPICGHEQVWRQTYKKICQLACEKALAYAPTILRAHDWHECLALFLTSTRVKLHQLFRSRIATACTQGFV